MQISDLKAGARKLIFDNAPKLVFISLLYIVLDTLMSEFHFRLMGFSDYFPQLIERLSAGEIPNLNLLLSFFNPYGVFFALLLTLMAQIIRVGYISYCMKMHRGSGGDYKDLFNGFLHFVKILLMSVLIYIITLPLYMLFIIPGLVVSYMFRQAYYILLDAPEKGLFQCLSESIALMRGNKLNLFLLDLSFLGWAILNLSIVLLIPTPFALPLISIWLTPYMGLAQAAFYDELIVELLV